MPLNSTLLTPEAGNCKQGALLLHLHAKADPHLSTFIKDISPDSLPLFIPHTFLTRHSQGRHSILLSLSSFHLLFSTFSSLTGLRFALDRDPSRRIRFLSNTPLDSPSASLLSLSPPPTQLSHAVDHSCPQTVLACRHPTRTKLPLKPIRPLNITLPVRQSPRL